MKTGILRLGVISTVLLFSNIVSSKTAVILESKSQDPITIQKPALYPETISYNPINDTFLVGSFREGAIYEIDINGNHRKFIDNERLKSSLGIHVDIARDRLLVATSDIGSSVRFRFRFCFNFRFCFCYGFLFGFVFVFVFVFVFSLF
ncbi:MAG: hypothetical protein HRU20_23850 [Pseudomonadales bacterium]|nr:hypothetical protein [Pseudomonadales bacterium]